MTYPLVRFVASPDTDSEVLFDFNTGDDWSDVETWVDKEGVSLGAPSLVGDPDSYGSGYTLRELDFTLYITGTFTDASQVWSALARQMRKRTNWLRIDFSEFAKPVWFKTYQTNPGGLDASTYVNTTDDSQSNTWTIPVTIPAESLAYGERVTMPAVTIANDPAAATNPCMAVLPEILGDAPAPARFEMTPNATLNIPSPMFAVTPVDDTFAAPIVYQFGAGDGATAFADADTTTSAAAWSGGSARVITFATNPAMALRLKITATGIRAGRYAMMLRVARVSSTAGVYAFKADVSARTTGPVVTLDRPTSPSSTYAQWLHLGDFTFPVGLSDFSSASTVSAVINLYAQQVSAGGSAAARVDALVLVPVELFDGEPGMRLTALPETMNAAPFVTRFDGDEEYVQLYNGSGAPIGASPATLVGQFPVLSPGRRNVLHLFRQTSGASRFFGTSDTRSTTDNSDDLTQTTTVTVSYHPRYLWLAP